MKPIRTGLGLLLLVIGLHPLVSVPSRAGLEVAGERVVGKVPLMSDNVDLAATLPFPGAIGANFRGDVVYVTGTAGLATYDISDPAQPVPLGVLPLPHWENEDVSLGGNTLIISADSAVGVNYVGLVDISNPRLPTLRQLVRPGVAAHTASCVNPYPDPDPRNCRFALLAGGRGVSVLDTVDHVVVAKNVAGDVGGTHDVQFDSDGFAWIAGGRGTAAYDVTDPTRPRHVAKTNYEGATGPLNDFIHHNSMRPDVRPGIPGDVVLITEEDYINTGCVGAGLFQSWRITGRLDPKNPAVLVPLDHWDTHEGLLPGPEDKTDAAFFCSAHYFDEQGGLAGVAWYGNGTRLLDVRDPKRIRQVGFFVPPVGEAWAAYWAPTDDSVLYVVDQLRGVDVLRVHRGMPPNSVAPMSADEERGMALASTARARPDPEFGWSCRLPAI